MRRWIVGMFALILSPALATSEQPTDEVRLDLVTYKQLGSEIKNLQGKVILVDFWADFCQPCKQKFPHVMSLHRKYASQGFTVVSVSVDDVTDGEARERVRAYLLQQKAICRNLLLADKPEVWIPRLKMDSVPAMILFDQRSQMINRWDGNQIDLAVIEKRIAELLKP